jgi:hypothetical protein
MKDDIVVLNYTQEAIRDLTTIDRNILAKNAVNPHPMRAGI